MKIGNNKSYWKAWHAESEISINGVVASGSNLTANYKRKKMK